MNIFITELEKNNCLTICKFFLYFRLEADVPGPRTCLLNQKLQLLNCCISKRIAREKRALNPQNSDESDSDIDDEFFDCCSDDELGEEEPRRRVVKHAPWDQPTGRSAKHGTYGLKIFASK